MLTTLIYRSQKHFIQDADLILLVEKANIENAACGVTGILLLKDNFTFRYLRVMSACLSSYSTRLSMTNATIR
jgi:hypothetical protein